MKFYTEQLYDSMQGLEPDTPECDAADARWKAACAAYRVQLESIRPRLPASMQAFCDTSLHDGRITAACRPLPDKVQLSIDASRNPWGPRGLFQLEFTGVKEVSPLEDTVGNWWLYEEVHLHPEAGFDYRVLLDGGEFRVVADDVRLAKVG